MDQKIITFDYKMTSKKLQTKNKFEESFIVYSLDGEQEIKKFKVKENEMD